MPPEADYDTCTVQADLLLPTGRSGAWNPFATGGRLAPELRVEPDGEDNLAGHGRGVDRLEAGGQVFGKGGVVEDAPIEPVLQAA